MGNIRHCIEDNDIFNFDGLKLLYVSTSKYEGDWQSICIHTHLVNFSMLCEAMVRLLQRVWNFLSVEMIW